MDTDFRRDAIQLLHTITSQLRADTITDAAFLRLPGNEPPWHQTSLRLRAGQPYSLFAHGRIQWSARDPELYGGPRFHLWARVSPGGRIVNLTQDANSFVADVEGVLELGVYMGMWQDEYGSLATSHELYRRLTGGLEVLAIGWQTDAMTGIRRLRAAGHALPCFAAELSRLQHPRPVPSGWRYLTETGHADIFASGTSDGAASIGIDAHDDQGIICTPVALALTPLTVLSWRWRLFEHPSLRGEDTVATHDYVSVATEFDNGRDLTWIWSSCLAPDTHFHCPIKAWTPRETHYVIRSGTADTGRWCHERRNVYHDVQTAMGSPPARIVRVWLIAVSTFQHGRLRAEVADIAVQNEAERRQVL